MTGATTNASSITSKPKPNLTLARVKFKDGINYHINQQYAKAIQLYDEAIAINPNYSMAYSNKGISLDELGKKQEAIKAYNRAIEINPKFTDAYVNKGTVLNELGKNIESIACYDKAISIDSRYTGAYYNKGNALKCLGQYEKVIEMQNIVIKLEPNHDLAHFAKAVALHCLGRPMESIQWFDKTIKLDPKNAQPYSEKGVVLRTLERFEDAIDYHDQALKIDSEYSLAYYYKGDALKGLKQYHEAIACFDEAIRQEPKEILFYCNKANVLNIIGDFGTLDLAYICFETARWQLICEDQIGMEGYKDLDKSRQKLQREIVRVSCVKIDVNKGENYKYAKMIRDGVVRNILTIINDKSGLSKLELEHVYQDQKYLWGLIDKLGIDYEKIPPIETPKVPKVTEKVKEEVVDEPRKSLQNKLREKRKENGSSTLSQKKDEIRKEQTVISIEKIVGINETKNIDIKKSKESQEILVKDYNENVQEIKIEDYQPADIEDYKPVDIEDYQPVDNEDYQPVHIVDYQPVDEIVANVELKTNEFNIRNSYKKMIEIGTTTTSSNFDKPDSANKKLPEPCSLDITQRNKEEQPNNALLEITAHTWQTIKDSSYYKVPPKESNPQKLPSTRQIIQSEKYIKIDDKNSEEMGFNISIPKKKNSCIKQNYSNGYSGNIMISTLNRKLKIKEHERESCNLKPEEDDLVEEIRVAPQADTNKIQRNPSSKKKENVSQLNTKMFFEDDDMIDLCGNGPLDIGPCVQNVDITESFQINNNRRSLILSEINNLQKSNQTNPNDLPQPNHIKKLTEENIESQCVNLAEIESMNSQEIFFYPKVNNDNEIQNNLSKNVIIDKEDEAQNLISNDTYDSVNKHRRSTDKVNIDIDQNQNDDNTGEGVVQEVNLDNSNNINTNNQMIRYKKLNRKKQEPIDIISNKNNSYYLDGGIGQKLGKQQSTQLPSSFGNKNLAQTTPGGIWNKKKVLRRNSDIVSVSLVSNRIKLDPISKENHIESVQNIEEIVEFDDISSDKGKTIVPEIRESIQNFVIKKKNLKNTSGCCFGWLRCSAVKKN